MMYVVDLFCGLGGFSCGATKAGHKIVLAIDNWDIAIQAHKYNHPKTAHYIMELGGDLHKVKNLIYAHIPKGSSWHLHGSPPCQNLSAANRTKGDIKEGMRLVTWYLELVKICRPTSWSMEQVIKARHYLEHLNIPMYIINTSDYGIPQTRKRLFIGEGWTLPVSVPGSNALSDKLPYLKNEGIVYIKGYSGTRSVVINGIHVGNIKLSGLEGFKTIDEPSYTLCAIGPLGLYDFRLNRVRSITIREAMIIQGFPNNYKIPDTITNKDAYSLIGNSVSPPIAYFMLKDIN